MRFKKEINSLHL